MNQAEDARLAVALATPAVNSGVGLLDQPFPWRPSQLEK
jgi:hypothetical protein